MAPGTYIAANWKLHKSRSQAAVWMRELSSCIGQEWAEMDDDTQDLLQTHHILLFPPLVDVEPVSERARIAQVELGAQRVSPYREGSYTGEISADHVRELGCKWTLVGHSERRHVFGEDSESINQQMHAALDAGLKPMLCVGEKLEQREAGEADAVLEEQIESGLEGLPETAGAEVAVAYEPVWAIGTGESADPETAQESAATVRDLLEDKFDALAADIPILYGGSVDPDNVVSFLTQPDINGALVGSASLEVDSFWELVKLSAAVHLRRRRESG